MTPHRCPVCGGAGRVPQWFYEPYRGGTGTVSNLDGEECRACEGKGVVWEPAVALMSPLAVYPEPAADPDITFDPHQLPTTTWPRWINT